MKRFSMLPSVPLSLGFDMQGSGLLSRFRVIEAERRRHQHVLHGDGHLPYDLGSCRDRAPDYGRQAPSWPQGSAPSREIMGKSLARAVAIACRRSVICTR